MIRSHRRPGVDSLAVVSVLAVTAGAWAVDSCFKNEMLSCYLLIESGPAPNLSRSCTDDDGHNYPCHDMISTSDSVQHAQAVTPDTPNSFDSFNNLTPCNVAWKIGVCGSHGHCVYPTNPNAFNTAQPSQATGNPCPL
ncbi:MAG: hypothetical protein JNM07_07690 [Phycisphaerae bacterium]|nr:hypothetical protein [Phycisphaerae bacterium]